MATPMTLSIRINADGTAAITGLRRVQGEIQRTGAVIGPVRTQTEGLAAQLKSLALTAGAAVSIGALANSFISANSAAGSLRASLETVTGSTKAATAAWGELQQFAATTPFSLEETVKGFVKLKALGLDPTREAMLSYANTASAMGKTLNDMVEAVADATTGEFERLKEFGIKASKEGEQVSLTFQGVTTTIGNSAGEIEAYLRRIGEVQFGGAIERQAGTLGVALSNVGDSWDQLMIAIGDAGLTEVMVDGLREVTGWIDSLKTSITGDLGAEVAATVAQLEAEFSGWAQALAPIPGAVAAIGETLAGLPNYVVVIRDGTLAIEEQGRAWEAVTELVGFAAQSFIDLPDNLRAAVQIILGEIDILAVQFQAGMDSLGPIAAQAWETIKYAIISAIQAIKIAVAEMVAAVAQQLAGLARDLANVAAQVPEVLDLGGVAQSAAAGLNDLAASLDGTTANVTKLKNEQAALGNAFADTTAQNEAQAESIQANAEAQVGAIRGVIQAALDEAQASKDRRAAQAELNAEFARAEAAQASLEKQTKATATSAENLTGKTSALAATTDKLSKAKGGAAAASKKLAEEQREEQQATAATNRAVQGLIARYLPARQAAEDYAEAQQAVNAALAGGEGSLKLSAEEASTILAGLAQDQAKAADAARREADAFYAAWADVVDSLDDTFKGLWRSLITGQGDVLGNLKETVLEWVADLSYQLLLSPLVVPIQGALMGMMGGGMGLGGGAGGMVGGVANAASGIGGMSNMFSGLSNGFSLVSNLFSGATFSGITSGFGLAMQNISTAGYFGAFGTNMSLAGSSMGSGAIGTAIGAALPYLIPAAIAVAGIGAIVSKWQKDQEPRYGTIVGMTGGSVAGLEDWENGPANYSRGAFGLTFGISDKGSKNMKASELKKTYDALAEVTDVLAQFFGDDLTAFITEELKTLSTFGDGLLHLTENEGDLGAAMAMLVENIATAAGRSSEDIGIAFSAMVGDLKGSAEEVGEQIQGAMLASILAVELSDRYDDSLGQMLDLTGDITGDVKRLKGYIDQFGTSGETSGETLARLVTQLGILDTAAQQTATDLDGLSATALIALSDELVAAFGGVDAATQAQAFYYQEFTTGTEKLVDAIQAAAKAINREVPKLQDELMKLSEDIIQEAKKIADDLDAGLEDLSGALEDTGNFWVDTQRRLADEWAKGIAENAAAIADGSASAATQAVTTWQIVELAAEGLGNYGDALRELGYDVDNGAEAIIELLNRVRDAVKDPLSPEGDGATPDTITIPGDPNAAILAKLLDDLPKTRQGFEDLIAGLDLTTEAGRKLYAGLLELAPQFDLLYDGAEAFTDWLLGVDEVGQATRELERVFQDWGLTLPENRDALKDLYDSGILTTEQMAILGAYLKELGIVFGEVGAAVTNTAALVRRRAEAEQAQADAELALIAAREGPQAALEEARRREFAAADESLRPILERIWAIEDETRALQQQAKAAEEAKALNIRLAEAMGDDALVLRLKREAELAAAADDANREILKQIYALEDEAAARAKVLAAQKEAEGLAIRLAEAQGNDELALRLRREQELAAATSDANREILKQIYALEDAAAAYGALVSAAQAERDALEEQYQARMTEIEAEREAVSSQHQARLDAIAAECAAVDALYRARVDAIAAEREAVDEAYRAQSEALAKQAEVAREALSAAEAGLSRIQSALDAFRGEAPRTEMERLRALRQLGSWATSGRLPDEDSLDRAIAGATNLDAQDFTTEASYRAAQGSAYSALLALEKVGVKQVSDAERQIAAIETASERAQAAYEAQIKALDEQADQAAAWRDAQLEILARQQDSADAWRDAELARLEKEAAAAEAWREENLAAIDDLLELAEKQLAILNGTYEETKSLAEALKDFNAALIDAGGEPLSPTQAGLDALLPPMGDIAAATNATTTEVIALRQEIVVLRQDLAAVATAQVVPLKAIDERLRKWDLDGMPSSTDTGTETALRAA